MSSYESERSQLNDILNQREYQIYYEDHRGLIQRIWDFIKEWIGNFLNILFESFDPNTTLGNTIITSLMVVLLVLIIIGLFVTIMIFMRRRRLKNIRPLGNTTIPDLGWQDHQEAAKKYAHVADYPLATRHQFLAFLLFLNHVNWLEAKRWKTNWEYYDELRGKQKELAEDFYQFALFFEQTTYGEQQVMQQDFEPYQTKINQWITEIQSQTEYKEAGES